MARTPPEAKAAAIEVAEHVLRHQFAFRGLEPVTLNPVDWDYAPRGHAGWRRDLNRHFYFSDLGFAYWYTGDRRFAKAFVELSSSWIEANLHRLGRRSWDDPFEVAARINAWLWAYFLFVGCPEWNPRSHKQFLTALGGLSGYLYRVIEYHRPGNHILLEAKALALCSGLFPEFTGSPRWGLKAWKIVEREIDQQISKDGVHAERSTMYHRIVAGELSELLLFCIRNDLPEARRLAPVVGRMAAFENAITAESAAAPLFGDSYSDDSYIRFSAPAVVGSLSGDAAPAAKSSTSTTQTLWAFGGTQPSFDSYLFERSGGESASKAFPDGGYFVSKWEGERGTSLLVWDCGPLGYKANFYHSHMDALSFHLSIDGMPLLVDPGTDEIDSGRRRYLRSTAAHNTVQIDGLDQSTTTADGRICRPARTRLIFWGSSRDCDVMIGSHDGYERLRDPAVHIRTILSMKNHYWLVFDRITGRESHKVEQRFHVASEATIERVSNEERFVITNGDRRVLLSPLCAELIENTVANLRVEIDTARPQPQFMRCEATDTIRISCAAAAPVSLAVLFHPLNPDEQPGNTRVDCRQCSQGFQSLDVLRAGLRDTIFVAEGVKQPREFQPGWSTDARVVVIRKNEMGEVTLALAADATTFARDSIEYVDTNRAVGILKIAFSKPVRIP